MEPLAKVYKRKRHDPLYQAVMDLIVRANRKQYEEGSKMCDALVELFADEFAEREEIATERGAYMKLISLVRRKQQKGLSVEEISGILEETQDLIQRICQTVKEHPEWTDGAVYEHLKQ